MRKYGIHTHRTGQDPQSEFSSTYFLSYISPRDEIFATKALSISRRDSFDIYSKPLKGFR